MKKKLIFQAMLMIAVFNYSIIIGQTKNVIVDQKSFDNVNIDSVSWYNLNQNKFDKYLAPKSFDWNIGSTQTLLGSQKLIDNQKYKNWENNYNPDYNVVNHKTFTIFNYTENLTSKFHPTNSGITIKTSLEGTTATGGVVEFRDPWFIDFQDAQYANQLRNRGMGEAYPRRRTSPFYPNETTQHEYGQTYRGVFLDQPMVAGRSYYKVSVPDEQIIQVHGQSRKFYPYYWTGSGVNYENQNEIETGVVFTATNATATAVLKGELMSNDPNGISSNSQRKIVRTDNGSNHVVYESMGSVWYATNLYGEWYDIHLGNNAKNPAIDYLNNKLIIVYEYWDGSLKLKYIEMDSETINITYQTEFELSNDFNDFGLVKPAVAVVLVYQQALVIYKKSASSNLKYRIRTFKNNSWYWSGENNIPNTDLNSLNPCVAGEKTSSSAFHIAHQQNNTVIKYMHADWQSLDELQFCSFADASQGSGFGKNVNPSIVEIYSNSWHTARICWIGERNNEIPSYTENTEKTVVFTASDYLGHFWTFGDNVTSTSINKTHDKYAIACLPFKLICTKFTYK